MKHATPVIEAVDAILRQGKIGEEFRADFENAVAKAHAAGCDTSCTHVHSEPLTDEEIAAFRDFARTAGKSKE